MYLNKFEQHLFKQQAYATMLHIILHTIYTAHSCAYIFLCKKVDICNNKTMQNGLKTPKSTIYRSLTTYNLIYFFVKSQQS